MRERARIARQESEVIFDRQQYESLLCRCELTHEPMSPEKNVGRVLVSRKAFTSVKKGL